MAWSTTTTAVTKRWKSELAYCRRMQDTLALDQKAYYAGAWPRGVNMYLGLSICWEESGQLFIHMYVWRSVCSCLILHTLELCKLKPHQSYWIYENLFMKLTNSFRSFAFFLLLRTDYFFNTRHIKYHKSHIYIHVAGVCLSFNSSHLSYMLGLTNFNKYLGGSMLLGHHFHTFCPI